MIEMEFLEQYHLMGLAVGLATFAIIGIFHPIVIKSEYYFGVKCWWWFLIAGIVGIGLSMWTDNHIMSALAGVFAFSSFWSIGEIFEQRKRVERGWFPANPKRVKSDNQTKADKGTEAGKPGKN